MSGMNLSAAFTHVERTLYLLNSLSFFLSSCVLSFFPPFLFSPFHFVICIRAKLQPLRTQIAWKILLIKTLKHAYAHVRIIKYSFIALAHTHIWFRSLCMMVYVYRAHTCTQKDFNSQGVRSCDSGSGNSEMPRQIYYRWIGESFDFIPIILSDFFYHVQNDSSSIWNHLTRTTLIDIFVTQQYPKSFNQFSRKYLSLPFNSIWWSVLS